MELDRVIKDDGIPLNILTVSKKDAASIIRSLSSQLFNDSSNTGREEYRPYVNGKLEYFSIFVDGKESI